MATVVLIDAGGTNIGSVRYALQRLGVDAPLSSDANEIRAATHVILPGVGAAAPGMARLRETGLVDVVRGLTQPVLGVCLGMQLLFEHSEESDTPCLGLIPATLRRFAQGSGLRVPHMGWNSLRVDRPSPLLAGIEPGAFAYFVHSYAAPVGAWTLASCDYGGAFSAVVQRGNFYGAQFHPERSAAVGARLLRNFITL
ncbi:MAG: imidazole glycerol phosphate synthase subunit HisH [Proteobacteria bacterium]|uniref:imidazole glycerol phosphate synthase subunit HisH n=1 Tax=Rudaea sp. TaxID=2136325 RepID=UPI003220474E|nr:imidazole glycerol phosphate synthase subunit HisH [Pseudomonadota bacterium]